MQTMLGWYAEFLSFKHNLQLIHLDFLLHRIVDVHQSFSSMYIDNYCKFLHKVYLGGFFFSYV